MGTPNEGPLERRPLYTRLSLRQFCAGPCKLTDPHIKHEPVLVSEAHLWSIFSCRRCGSRGILNVSIKLDCADVYPWTPYHPIVKLYIMRRLGETG